MDDQPDEGEGREWLPDEYSVPDIRVITITVSADNDWKPQVDYHAGISPWEAAKLIEEAGNIMAKELEPISTYQGDE